MPNFGEPDADWTDEYEWTRYRGPQPYPCPEDWCLDEPEGLYYRWTRYPDVGEAHGTSSEVDVDVLDHENIDEHREEEAWLIGEVIGEDRRDETTEWKLELDNETLFRRVEPDWDELMATVAEVLSRFSNGETWREPTPSTGRLPEDIRKEQEIERRSEQNQSLTAFSEGDH